MRDRGSHNPSGSFADLTTKPVNRIKGQCGMCGAGLSHKGKKFCMPCYDQRLEGFNRINRAKYAERQKAKKAALSSTDQTGGAK